MTRMLATLAAILLIPSISGSHPGGLDTYGCHNNSKLNSYECHKGDFPGKSWPNPGGKEAMLLEANPPPPPPVCPELPATPKPSVTSAEIGHVLEWSWEPTNGKQATFVVFWTRVPDPRDYPKGVPLEDLWSWYGPVPVGTDKRVILTTILTGETYAAKVYAVVDGVWSLPSETKRWTVQ